MKNLIKSPIFSMVSITVHISPLLADNSSIINKYLSPSPFLRGDWTLTDLQLDSDVEESLFETRIIHNPGEKTTRSDIVIANSKLLGNTINGEQFQLSHSLVKNYNDAFIKIHFTTSKGILMLP